MSVKVENLEKSMAKLTVTVSAVEFEKALEQSFRKNKNRFNVPGFRKGKATRQMVEKMFGESALYDDALNFALDASYPDASRESGLAIVSRPEISIEQIGKGQDLIYTASVAVKPEVTLGEYKGVTAEKAETTVSAKEVTERLNRELEKNARIVEVERSIKTGDTALIDFVGTIDGAEFAGGKGEDYPLEIGSGTFIPGFEDQLIGHKTGEAVEVNVSFPEDYGAKELAGKAAVFQCTIKSVKEKQIPKADDEFASEVSEFETLEEYKKDLKKQLKEQKDKQATTQNENNVVRAVVANASVELPKPMVDMQLDQMFYDYTARLQQQGIPMDQYMQITGQNEQDIKEQMRSQAEEQIKTSLVLEAIQKKENITVADERVEEEFNRIAEQYKMKPEDLMKTVTESQRGSVKQELAVQETIDMLVAEAKLVKPEKKSKKDEAAEEEREQ